MKDTKTSSKIPIGSDCKDSFRRAYENRYTWENSFSGYKGKCSWTSAQNSLQGSFSIRKKDEKDYQDLRQHLYYHHMSVGEYLVSSYRELDKGSSNNLRLKEIRWSR